MKQESYNFVSDDSFRVYSFVSVGVNGSIQKLIKFSLMEADIYNLALLDIDPLTDKHSDMVRSNNGDSQKVLVTVANAVMDFTDHYPNTWVFATGSTAARTRLYQIGIANNIQEIEQYFEVLGLSDSGWQSFKLGETYKAFLVKRKII